MLLAITVGATDNTWFKIWLKIHGKLVPHPAFFKLRTICGVITGWNTDTNASNGNWVENENYKGGMYYTMDSNGDFLFMTGVYYESYYKDAMYDYRIMKSYLDHHLGINCTVNEYCDENKKVYVAEIRKPSVGSNESYIEKVSI